VVRLSAAILQQPTGQVEDKMPLSDEDAARFDLAAAKAEAELKTLIAQNPSLGEPIIVLAKWWRKNIAAGYKRLGRILFSIGANR
jgi:hypothetical protein